MNEAAVEKKKKRAEKARKKHEKEMEIAQRVRAKENRSDIESELESEDPTEMGDDMISSEDERGEEVVVTSVEHREPTATSASGVWDAERHDDVPMLRKRATSSDTIGEWEAKWTRSSCPSEVSSALSPPAPGQVRRSEEQAHTYAFSRPTSACDPQQGDALLVASVGMP